MAGQELRGVWRAQQFAHRTPRWCCLLNIIPKFLQKALGKPRRPQPFPKQSRPPIYVCANFQSLSADQASSIVPPFRCCSHGGNLLLPYKQQFGAPPRQHVFKFYMQMMLGVVQTDGYTVVLRIARPWPWAGESLTPELHRSGLTTSVVACDNTANA